MGLGFIWESSLGGFVLPSIGEICDPTYAKVDAVLELITKSKSLHILMILERAKHPIRFTEIKMRVDASSTTVSRRLNELEQGGLVARLLKPESSQTNLYMLSEEGLRLSPVMQALFDWAKEWNEGNLPT